MSQTFPDHFSGVASRYADFRPHYPAELFDYLATLVPRNSLVWDCAAGNGQATLDLAQSRPRMSRRDKKLKFILEQRTEIEHRCLSGFQCKREVHTVFYKQFQRIGSIAWLNVNHALRKAFLKLPQHPWQDILASGSARADPQSAMSPFAKFVQPFPGRFHLRQNFFRVRQQLFARLCEND